MSDCANDFVGSSLFVVLDAYSDLLRILSTFSYCEAFEGFHDLRKLARLHAKSYYLDSV